MDGGGWEGGGRDEKPPATGVAGGGRDAGNELATRELELARGMVA